MWLLSRRMLLSVFTSRSRIFETMHRQSALSGRAAIAPHTEGLRPFRRLISCAAVFAAPFWAFSVLGPSRRRRCFLEHAVPRADEQRLDGPVHVLLAEAGPVWRWASLSQRQHGMEGCGGEQWGQSAASLCDEAVLGSPRSSCLRASASAGSRVLCPLGLSWDAVGPCLACVPTPWRGRRCCPSVSSLAWTTAAYAWEEPGDSKVGGVLRPGSL